MSGILSPCGNPFFPMKCDVYYANESQDKYGKVRKSWQLDGTVLCSFYTRDDDTNNNNFSYDDKKLYRLETTLFGRVQSDIRQSFSGMLYPVSHILITNIRSGGCNDETLYFYETNMEYETTPTIFEIVMSQPYIGPFGKVDYFKMQLQRSDTQELNELVAN